MSSSEADLEPTGVDDASSEMGFSDGFTWRTFVGALFIACFMIPGGIYLGLVAGYGIGEAAEWVTIVLFAEVARRSFRPLRRQEIYILFYMASALTTVVNQTRGLYGGPFSSLIWNAYFVQSESAQSFVKQVPSWAVPQPEHVAVAQRELWHPAWWTPIVLLAATELCGRLSWMSMGYALFRLTSDVERLPFPYAPVAASGATALAEAGTESWRWRIFSTGSVVGLLFGAVYVALPVISDVLIGHSVVVLPIPFADYTIPIENLLPAAIVGLSFSLGNVLMGFVLPFQIVLGATVASVLAMVVMNPILYHAGMLPSYRLGSNAFVTKVATDMDFWLSVGIGVNIAVAILGIALVAKAIAQARRFREERRYSLTPPDGRGDLPIWIAMLVWFGSTMGLVVLCRWLIPTFPSWILIVFGLLWSPLNSYVSARMHGLTGRGVGFPYLKEASIVASGYPKADVWYAPVPLYDHGWAAQRFREVELTGTRFTSIWKAEALMFPLILVASFGFWAFFWKANPVPSASFPYAQAFWPLEAKMQAVIQQINLPKAPGEHNWFLAAIKPGLIAGGAAGGLALYGVLSLFKVPMLFFYGFAGGLGLFPANTLPQLAGAWFGRKYMARKFGEEAWMRYAPVLLAGFSCGTGLSAMAGISVALVAKSVVQTPY
ncbi:MAG: peptide transporter [Armatimonadetes bacterium]|nr:peptide transporter [Armatimonadota bacterium]